MLTFDYDRADIGRGDRVLDVGCGSGRHTFEAARRGANVIALDIDDAVLKDARAGAEERGLPGVEPVAADLTALPFPDATFDRVIAAEVLEHVASDERAIEEIVRVTRPDGVVVVTVPRSWPERICWALSRAYREKPGGHVRIYRRRELLQKLESSGTSLTHLHHAHALHTPYWWLKCAIGVDRDDALLARLYHRFLVWDLMRRPIALRVAERVLAPILGKSVVIYLRRSARA